jgi:hypothetical protein
MRGGAGDGQIRQVNRKGQRKYGAKAPRQTRRHKCRTSGIHAQNQKQVRETSSKNSNAEHARSHTESVCVCVWVCDHDKLGCHGNLIVPIGGLGYDQIFQTLDAFFNRGLVAERLSHGIAGVKSALLRQHEV